MVEEMIFSTPKLATLPLIARLSASVPPLVKKISPGEQPNILAMLPRASSISPFTFLPWAWVELGFPKWSRITGIIASTTSSAMGVVAALSR